MILPTLKDNGATRDMVTSFLGYEHRDRISDGAFYDSENLSCDLYPVLSVRKGRAQVVESESVTGIIAKDALCYTAGTKFHMNQYEVDMNLSSSAKTLVSMGAYVVIFPDRKYINTSDLTDYGNLEAHVAISTTVSYSMTDMDASAISPTVSSTAPGNPSNMDYWMDTSQNPHVLKQWSASSSMWVSVATSYIKIAANGIGAVLKEGDGVFFTGLPASMSDYAEGASVLQKVYHGADGVGDYLLILGQLDSTTTTAGLTVDRKLPDMDFVIESNNRLWGCKYGIVNGKAVNEIYASKLGDFKNWYCYEGISTDSYAVSLGSDGVFTGAFNYLGYPIFFKETCLHKIYGAYPAQYQLQTTPCRGVQAGSSKSLAMVNEVLYYKSSYGVMAYDGSLPSEVSSALGDERYSAAVGGAIGNRYYIDMQCQDGIATGSSTPRNDRVLFLLDVGRGVWQKEDSPEAAAFANCRGSLYYYNEDGIYMPLQSAQGGNISWYGVTGPMGLDSPDGKYISRVTLRLALESGSVFGLYIEYDSSGEWVREAELIGNGLRSFSLPIRLRRCDHFRMKIEGSGGFKLFSIAKTVEHGGEWT